MVVKSVGHPAKVCGQSGNLFIERMVIIIAFPPHTRAQYAAHISSVSRFAFWRTIALLAELAVGAAAVVIRTFVSLQKKQS